MRGRLNFALTAEQTDLCFEACHEPLHKSIDDIFGRCNSISFEKATCLAAVDVFWRNHLIFAQ